MALKDECDHEMLGIHCPPCDGSLRSKTERWRRRGDPFPARYGSAECRGCGERIEPHDVIQMWTRAGELAYTHEACDVDS